VLLFNIPQVTPKDTEKSMEIQIEKYSDAHRTWARRLLEEHWGSRQSVTRGKIYSADLLPGFVAMINKEPRGLLTYIISGSHCEIVTLNSLKGGVGVGTMLIEAAKKTALQAGCHRLWLITTNDNLPAIRFYQKRRFELVAVHRGAIAESRKLKPEIPHIGLDGIPIRDEIELEMRLSPSISPPI
jgi:ribosomal protein S18 acetylase RimI-like enzyme